VLDKVQDKNIEKSMGNYIFYSLTLAFALRRSQTNALVFLVFLNYQRNVIIDWFETILLGLEKTQKNKGRHR
jgi:hypothetical protein